MLLRLLIILLLTVSSAFASKIEEKVDSCRTESYAYFDEALPDCKIDILPNYIKCSSDQEGKWYLLLDGPGLFLERAIFTFDSESFTCERTPTPCFSDYRYKDLSGIEAAWTVVSDSVFTEITTAKNATITLDHGETDPRIIKFSLKARSALCAFRDSVLTRIERKYKNRYSIPQPSIYCDQSDVKIIDTTCALFDMGMYAFRKPKNSHWTTTYDKIAGMVTFERKHEELAENLTGKKLGFSRIQIFPNEVERSQWGLSEEQIADNFRAEQELSMLKEGVYKHLYDLTIISKRSECVGQNRMHYFIWHVLHPTSPGGNINVLYLSFPPDFKSTHSFDCIFFSGVSGKVIETYKLSNTYYVQKRGSISKILNDLADFHAVLASFQYKNSH